MYDWADHLIEKVSRLTSKHFRDKHNHLFVEGKYQVTDFSAKRLLNLSSLFSLALSRGKYPRPVISAV
jgi:hypothetical protein